VRKIAVINQKGGVGKTTTVVNTAAALAASGSRVLVIDMDPQAHLTIHLGVEPGSVEKGSYEILSNSAKFKEAIMPVRDNLWLMGANINLVGAESELVSVVGREAILREALKGTDNDFDFLFIDCPPSLGLLTLNSLVATDEVFIPVQPHFLALQGFGKLLETVSLVNERINPRLKVSAILLCMFETRASLPAEVKADIEGFLAEARGKGLPWSDAQLIPVCIRRNIKLAEAPSYGKTVFEYDPSCNGAADYLKVVEAFIGKSIVLPVREQPKKESTPATAVPIDAASATSPQ
jgi:chromosome partitioning protein